MPHVSRAYQYLARDAGDQRDLWPGLRRTRLASGGALGERLVRGLVLCGGVGHCVEVWGGCGGNYQASGRLSGSFKLTYRYIS